VRSDDWGGIGVRSVRLEFRVGSGGWEGVGVGKSEANVLNAYTAQMYIPAVYSPSRRASTAAKRPEAGVVAQRVLPVTSLLTKSSTMPLKPRDLAGREMKGGRERGFHKIAVDTNDVLYSSIYVCS
jgi:hypothetical protein